MISLEAKVGARGQTVIPKPLRDRMGIEPGDTVRFRLEGDHIVVDAHGGEEVLEALLDAAEKEPEPDTLDLDETASERFREQQG